MTPWTVAYQAPLSMEFSRQGYWSGLPFPSAGGLPNPGVKPGSPALQADSLLSELQGRPKPKVNVKSLSHVRLFVTPWTVAYQAPLPMGFSRQEYWGRLPFPSPGDLSDPGMGPAPPALADRFFTTEPPGKLCVCVCVCVCVYDIFFIYSYGTGTTTEI